MIAAIRARQALADSRPATGVHEYSKVSRPPAHDSSAEVDLGSASTCDADFHLEATAARVQAWSTFCVPYEPHSFQQKKLRTQLQVAIDRLCDAVPTARYGIYAAPAALNSGDTENSLFYNMGRWESVSRDYPVLQFIRLPSKAMRPSPRCDAPRYYYEYGVRSLAKTIKDGVGTDEVLHFSFEIDSSRSLQDPALVWVHAARALLARTHQSCSLGDAPFGLQVHVSCGAGGRRGMAVRMKPLFDGLLCAMHAHVPSSDDTEEIIGALSNCAGAAASEVRVLLGATDKRILGHHRFLLRRGKGLQFSPRDDRCVAGELRLTELQSATTHCDLDVRVFRA